MPSSENHLNIIAFDVPYPPNYGGVIDIFYKAKALADAGIRIHLHCFAYGRHLSDEMQKTCAEVYYYPRKTTKSLLFNSLPYIVLSRESEELKKNLLKNDYPILMEGLHDTFLLSDIDFSNRKKIVRTHNIEHEYYENLAKAEKNIFKRYYYYNEAGKLRKYESVLKKASCIAAISPNDTKYFSTQFKDVIYLPAFHPDESITSQVGNGNYAFYHGNLAVAENNEAALFLVRKVFNDLDYPLIIAGSKPSSELISEVGSRNNIKIKDDLTPAQIHEYIRNAQCNVLPTFQSTGIKLKLLAALFAGRFCIVNKPMVVNTGLEELCIVADTADEMKKRIIEISEKSFPEREIKNRTETLFVNFSNTKNAEKLIDKLF